MAKDPPKKGPVSPWLAGVTGVTGIVPPGRRLSPPTEKRPSRWSASGVHGVTPPGHMDPKASSDWRNRPKRDKSKDIKKAERTLQQKRASGGAKGGKRGAAQEPEAFDPMRPMAGFVPDAFADAGDPGDLKAFLKHINDFLGEHRPNPEVAESFGQLILQSHAPYELVVAFTILTTVVGKSTPLRRRYALALERGAKAFFNLAGRLNSSLKAPRGLVPETLDALFYDLPATAYQIPYAYATDALLRQLELLRRSDDEDYDRALTVLATDMRRRFIEKRSFGDTPLDRMFPFDEPEWFVDGP